MFFKTDEVKCHFYVFLAFFIYINNFHKLAIRQNIHVSTGALMSMKKHSRFSSNTEVIASVLYYIKNGLNIQAQNDVQSPKKLWQRTTHYYVFEKWKLQRKHFFLENLEEMFLRMNHKHECMDSAVTTSRI